MLNGVLQFLWFSCTCQSKAIPSSSAWRKTQQVYITHLREYWRHLRYCLPSPPSVYLSLLWYINVANSNQTKKPKLNNPLPQTHLYPKYVFLHPIISPILVLFSARWGRDLIRCFLSSIQSHSPFNIMWMMRELELTCQIWGQNYPAKALQEKKKIGTLPFWCLLKSELYFC